MLQFCNDVMNSIPFLAKFAGKIAEPMVVLLSHVPSSSFACSIAKKTFFSKNVLETCFASMIRSYAYEIGCASTLQSSLFLGSLHRGRGAKISKRKCTRAT